MSCNCSISEQLQCLTRAHLVKEFALKSEDLSLFPGNHVKVEGKNQLYKVVL